MHMISDIILEYISTNGGSSSRQLLSAPARDVQTGARRLLHLCTCCWGAAVLGWCPLHLPTRYNSAAPPLGGGGGGGSGVALLEWAPRRG